MDEQEACVGAPQANLQRGEEHGYSTAWQVSTAYLHKLQSGSQTSLKKDPKHVLHGMLPVVFNHICTRR